MIVPPPRRLARTLLPYCRQYRRPDPIVATFDQLLGLAAILPRALLDKLATRIMDKLPTSET